MNPSRPNKELVVLAYDWPGPRGGYRLSCQSSLLSYLKVFSRVHFVGICETKAVDPALAGMPDVEWIHVPTVTRPKWLRFAISLFSRLPAITMRYTRASRGVLQVLADVHKDCQSRNRELYAVMQDVPMGCYMRRIRRRFPALRIAMSSHNLSIQVFAGLTRAGSLPKRLAWRLEIAKTRKFEVDVCGGADRFWAITEAEAHEYEKELGVRPDGVFHRGLDTERYGRVAPGDPNVVVHVGAADLIKGAGLNDFIVHVWPRVVARMPQARLVLGGRDTERFTNRELGITGLGFVSDELDVLNQGMIFLNSQRIGAGLQFKSLVAMLSGKTLLATPMSIEGVEGQDGRDFVVAATNEQMTETLVSLMQNPEAARKIGRAGQQLAASTRSHEYAAGRNRPLLEDFADLPPTR